MESFRFLDLTALTKNHMLAPRPVPMNLWMGLTRATPAMIYGVKAPM